jgi:AraC family transcriptional regulator
MGTTGAALKPFKSSALQQVLGFGQLVVYKGGLTRLRLKRALDYIQANLGSEIHLEDLARAVGLSPFHFAKLFKLSTGSTPHQYVLQRRLERATELLRSAELSLSEVALECGFADQSHFANVFRRFMGVTPSQFRARL